MNTPQEVLREPWKYAWVPPAGNGTNRDIRIWAWRRRIRVKTFGPIPESIREAYAEWATRRRA